MLPLVEARRHRLQYAPPPPDVRVSIDRVRMGMALTNVLNNALRFTPENGRIIVQSGSSRRTRSLGHGDGHRHRA